MPPALNCSLIQVRVFSADTSGRRLWCTWKACTVCEVVSSSDDPNVSGRQKRQKDSMKENVIEVGLKGWTYSVT